MPAPRRVFQNTQRFQRLDTFAQRIPADAELRGQLAFGRNQRSRGEVVFIDIGAQTALHGNVEERCTGG